MGYHWILQGISLDTVDHANSKEFVYYEACKQPRNVIGPLEQRDKSSAWWVVTRGSRSATPYLFSLTTTKWLTVAAELEYKLCSIEN